MSHLTRRNYEDLVKRIDQLEPTRARAVLKLIDSLESTPTPNRKQRRNVKRQGHPARSTSRQRRKHWHDKPDEREQKIRELNRLMRDELQRSSEEDGEVAGPLAVVAKYVTPQLLNDFGLDPAEHEWPFRHWLMAKFGDVLRDPDPNGYIAWRQQSLAQIRNQER